MNYLSIAFLAALPLAAAPLLLHFFDRRRHVVIEWGAMQFLQEAATRRTSARRLREWLLLLLRVAALAALVLALARPLAPGNWLGASTHRETIVIIDNSMSLMRTVDDQPLFAQLLQKAEETLDSLDAGDSVRVLLASPYPVWVTAGSVRMDAAAKARLLERLEAVRPTSGSSDLLASLFTAVQSDAAPTLGGRRVVLLTDDQGSDWKLDDVAGWRRFQAAIAAAPLPTQLEVVALDSRDALGNLSVAKIRSSRTVVGVGQPFSVTAQIQNHSQRPSRQGRQIWQVDGRQRQVRDLPELEGGASHDVAWKHAFDQTGVFAVSCQIDAGDAMAVDNLATVVVEVVERVPVLLVEGAGELTDVQRDAFFVQAALGRVEGEDPSDWQSVYAPRTVDPETLESTDLERYRAVVVPNLTVLSERAVERLRRFVADGGGLWLALGPRTDVDAFNHYFFSDGDGLSPLSIAGPADLEGDSEPTRLNPFGKDHPAVAELADVERLDTGDVKVTGRMRFNTGISYDNVSVLLDLTNGEPLAVEKYVGRGRVIVQSIPLRYQWSDLALSQSFVVMVHDWLAYLSQPLATRHNLGPGDPITVHLTDSQYTEATLFTPDGGQIDLASEPAGDGVVFRSSRTVLPGEYSLELGLTGEQIPFYVARDPRESNLAALAAVDRQLLAETRDLSREAVSRRMLEGGQKDPVWPLLLVALAALIAGELWLSSAIARQRFGGDEIAETTEDWMEEAGSVAQSRLAPSGNGSGAAAASDERQAEKVGAIP